MKTESLAVRISLAAVDSWTIILRAIYRVERIFNSLTCAVMNGGHELYTIRGEPNRLFQRCLLCGHETKGWKVGK